MGLLAAERCKSVIRDDMWCAKVLELCAISAGFLRQRHEMFGAFEITIVVRGDIGNEVGGLVEPNSMIADLKFAHAETVVRQQIRWGEPS